MPAKVAVIYYSSTGTVHVLAEAVADGAEKAGAQVRLLRVRRVRWADEELIAAAPASEMAAYEATAIADPADIVWADAVVIGSPTRFGNVCAPIKHFLDQLGPYWARNELADKVYSGFTATSSMHGGQETTLLALYNAIYHFGGLIAPPGYLDAVKHRDGNPYGTSHVVDQASVTDDSLAAARFQGRRVAELAECLIAGKANQQAGNRLEEVGTVTSRA
jgi:NAD(P)H:quinone oxidoreductase type IV